MGTALLLCQSICAFAADDTTIYTENSQDIIVFSPGQMASSQGQPPIFTEPPSDGNDTITIMPELPRPMPDSPTPTPELPENDQAGEISIEREKMKNAIKPGENFSFTLILTNRYQKANVSHVKLSLDLPSGIQYTKDWEKETLNLKDLNALSSQKQNIQLMADKDLSGQAVVKIKAIVTYKYYNNHKLADGKSEETLLLPVANSKDTTSKEDNYGTSSPPDIPDSYGTSSSVSGTSEQQTIDPITPNIMVKRFTYKKGLKAGEDFMLELEFVNTSRKLAIENAIVNISPGEAIHIADNFSSFYIEKLNPGETAIKKIRMCTLPDGKPEGGEVSLETKYEYLKGTERTQASISDKLGIAFEQTDRFSIGDIQAEKEITANEETSITVPFVNKGKIPVYNLEARLETNAECQDSYKYLGNVESGTSGTVDFFVTPLQAGQEKIKITLSYEDSQTRVKTETREILINAQEAIADSFDMEGIDMDIPDETENTGILSVIFHSIYTKLGVAAFILIASFLLWKSIKKKKNSSEEAEL